MITTIVMALGVLFVVVEIVRELRELGTEDDNAESDGVDP